MATVTCKNGHFYDSALGTCPICARGGHASVSYGATAPDNIPATEPAAEWGGMGSIGATEPASEWGRGGATEHSSPYNATFWTPAAGKDVGATQPVTKPGFTEGDFVYQKSSMDDYGPTMPGAVNNVEGFDPIVGWLVCVKGPNRGKDYRLHSGTNFIGRSKEMDVCIEHDQTISKRNAAMLTYDDRSKMFFIQKGEVRNLMYLNGKPALSVVDIHKFDRIEIGATELVFIPLCGEEFNWQDV